MPPAVADRAEVREAAAEGAGRCSCPEVFASLLCGGAAVALEAEAKPEPDGAAEVPGEEVKAEATAQEEMKLEEVEGPKDAIEEARQEEKLDAKEAPKPEELPQEADSWLCRAIPLTHGCVIMVLCSSLLPTRLLLELRMLERLKKKSTRR